MSEDLASTRYAESQDKADPLHRYRDQFNIPTRNDLTRDTASRNNNDDSSSSIYLCGNSLGLQPKQTRQYFEQYLDTWATKGVFGHFKSVNDTRLEPWLHVDADAAALMAKVVGALPDEVAVMQTLTMNLHLMMASFYRPTQARRKIIIETKAFPSDHYAVQSQIRHHGFDIKEDLILLEPSSDDSPCIHTDHILSVIDKHADSTALLLLPGIQFYTGQLFDIPTITSHAKSKGIVVGWDLAHAAGNVPVHLHDWGVDFAVWCTYKYLNCGPGSIGGCFVHSDHGKAASESDGDGYRHRLAGWWGSSKSSRFAMTNVFEPIDGAAGFQLSNPSVADLTAVRASLDIFTSTTMDALRAKSLKLTGYLEKLLDILAKKQRKSKGKALFKIITPRNEAERGAQLSVLLKPGLLDNVMHILEEEGVILDERRPDVIRVAPTPLYNTFSDVLKFIQVFEHACEIASSQKNGAADSVMKDGGADVKGWSEIK
ncbi:kynureninase [Polychaeton citri CBS 116435]|uniref:Kynureninase n=1 Tax=Polychaeton citri CBS 116435 TaxID=1314669 RepID=A0A9P4UTA8_9PEZI|nr:kynureninase [Polychaeton citri CBS 116435]